MVALKVTVDQLARSRFVVSPLIETIAALTMFDQARGPWQASYRAANLDAYQNMLADHPVRRALGSQAWRPRVGDQPGWMADFLCVPPVAAEVTFDQELEHLCTRWGHSRIHAALAQPVDVPHRIDLRVELAALLRWIWATTIESDWPRRRRVLHADIVSRTDHLARAGWSRVIPTLGANRSWLGDGRLQVSRYDDPDLVLEQDTSLFFVPAHVGGSWVSQEDNRTALIYPVNGALADIDSNQRAGGISKLLGANREAILRILAQPQSTTHLSAVTGLPMGAVGNHLRVLLDAGLIMRRRAGRHVLYWRTALGENLMAQDNRATPPVRATDSFEKR